MQEAKYYLSSVDGWLIHTKECVKLPAKRVFLGTLYHTQQALTVARVHCAHASLCPVCLGKTAILKHTPVQICQPGVPSKRPNLRAKPKVTVRPVKHHP